MTIEYLSGQRIQGGITGGVQVCKFCTEDPDTCDTVAVNPTTSRKQYGYKLGAGSSVDGKQLVLKNKGLRVTYKDHIMGMDTIIYPDKVILSSAIVPQEDAGELSQMLKIPLNEDNFFMEAHVKLRPVDFSAEGVYLAGLAHSPKNMEETISQAKAASERATMIISSDKYIAEANIAKVDLDACAGCGMCVSVCPYGAPELFWRNGKEFAHINSALCKGCGSCAAVCPSGAMQQLGYKEEQQLAMLTEALEVW